MDVFCTQDFKVELQSLLKDKKYKSYEKLIIKFFLGNNPLSATIINGVNPPIPLLKKRIGGKKALRVYYYLFEITFRQSQNKIVPFCRQEFTPHLNCTLTCNRTGGSVICSSM